MIARWDTPFRALVASLRILWARWRGFQVLVTEDEAEDRRDTCHGCDRYHSPTDQCEICTCFVAAKSMIATEQCPKRLWLRIWRKRGTV